MTSKKTWHDALDIFKADPGMRLKLSKPFIVGERTYATDTYRAISIKCAYTGHYDTMEENRRIAEIFEEIRGYMQSERVGVVDLSEILEEIQPLKTAKKQERKDIKCKECGGSGTSECPHCNQDMDCEECDGDGNAVEWVDTDIPDFPDETYINITIPGEVEKSTNVQATFLSDLIEVWQIFGKPEVKLHIRNLKDPAYFTMISKKDKWEVEVIIMPVTSENVVRTFFTK